MKNKSLISVGGQKVRVGTVAKFVTSLYHMTALGESKERHRMKKVVFSKCCL